MRPAPSSFPFAPRFAAFIGRWPGLIGLLIATSAAAALGLSLGLQVLAALVGLTLGRVLAGRRSRGGSRRTLKFTREGRYLVAITLGIGFAAINTGNNLLFLVLGMLLSLIVVSGVLSEHALRALEVTRDLPRQVHAGRPFLTGIRLHNRKRRLPSFSIQVEDIVEGRPIAKKCYFLKVPAGASQQTSYRTELARRGAYTYEGLRISTRFPFSFFLKARQISLPGTLVVLPRVLPVAELPVSARALVGELVQLRRGQGREFHGLRVMRPEDDARDVHWKRSAREGRLILREYARQASRRILVHLNDRVPETLDLQDPSVAGALDECCDLAASLLVHLTRAGYAVELGTTDRVISVDPDGRGLPEALHHLALVPFTVRAGGATQPQRSEGGVLVTHRAARALVGGAFGHVIEPGGVPIPVAEAA